MRKKTTGAILIALALFAGAATARELSVTALGNSGEVYEILSGRYEELFPEGDEFPGDNHVLALAVTRGDARERYLLPGTGSPQKESAAALFYERSRGNLVVLWRGSGADEAELLNIVTFAGGSFSDAYEVADPALSSVAAPRVVVTHDVYDIQLSENEWESIERTVLHLLWVAHDKSGFDVRYSPLIFVEGVYSGWNQVVSLRDITALPEERPRASAEALYTTLGLTVSENGQRVVASFVNSLDGVLRVVEIGVLPQELTYMGQEVRDELNGLEASFANEELSSFADIIRAEVINVGRRHRLHPAFTDYVADQVGKEILVVGGEYSVSSYHELVEYLRTFTLRTAAPLVTASANGSLGSGTILEVDVGNLSLDATGPSPLINLRVLSSLPVPRIAGDPTALFASSDGRHVLLSWADGEGHLGYVENEADGWTEPRSLVLGDYLSAERAYEVLAGRVR